MPCCNAGGRPSVSPVTLNHLSQVLEQPLHRALGLTDWEADRIQELLGREANHFELAVFSLLWSEHCGYKHSAPLLKRLPSQGERVLQGPGENAGVLDLGEGLAVAFKVESHNHPSPVEPFQGAATGIGGILRDIVAMGARPIALLDGLWFDAPGHQFERAVAGIGAYGNSVGVANVGGATVFDEGYAGNCLVNAMCVGILDSARLQSAKASGPGNLVVLYGATAGRGGWPRSCVPRCWTRCATCARAGSSRARRSARLRVTASCARSGRARSSAPCPRGCSPTSARATRSSRRRPTPGRSTQPRSARRTARTRPGSTSSTTSSSARARFAGRGSTT